MEVCFNAIESYDSHMLILTDVIQAWIQNGIVNVVGDNTRPVLLNTVNEFWPLISTVANNGYAGLTIMPRWATTIFYNCDTPACTTAEWINTSGGTGDFTSLLLDAKNTNTRSYSPSQLFRTV